MLTRRPPLLVGVGAAALGVALLVYALRDVAPVVSLGVVFAITGGENWVALVGFFLAAALTSSLTQVARRRAVDAGERRQEADLSAEMAAAARRYRIRREQPMKEACSPASA